MLSVNANLILRSLQILLALTCLGFSSYVTHWYLAHTHPSVFPDEPVYLIFVGAFSLLTMPYLLFNAPLQISSGARTTNARYFNKYAVFALDLLSCALWSAAWIALAVFRSNLVLCGGHVCAFMGWGAGLGAVVSITYIVTTGLALVHILRTRGGSKNGPIKAGKVEEGRHEAWVGMEQKSS